MTLKEAKPLDLLNCSHCESLGEISLDSLKRKQKDIPIKLWIRNLPAGISESGLRNLFITVGEPLSVSLHNQSKSAFVELRLMNEVELAIRDLHCKPPYNLKVKLANPRPEATSSSEQPARNEQEDMFVNVTQLGANGLKDCPQQNDLDVSRDEQVDKILSEVKSQIKSIVKILGYDPSLRMRQKKLDFKTDSKCVSKGRGYLHMGNKDLFIGGLQKFQCGLENGRAKDMMSFTCTNCKALTTKICGRCSASFCSKACLSTSADDHLENCFARHNEEQQSGGNERTIEPSVEDSLEHPLPEVSLKSGCTVVMASYHTMVTVFVRPCDSPWEENFRKLCNDVAVEALKGNELQRNPSYRDLVIARYYEDLCFYRAQVYECVENKVTVFFVDFGNKQETRLEDIKPLPAHLKSLPGLAVKVQLKGVTEISSIDAVNYYNKLTAEATPLTLNFDPSTNEVVLIERDEKTNVNETAFKLALPSWKKDRSAFSKTGEIFYLDSIRSHKLEIGKTHDLTVSHFDEKEFQESEVFWVTERDTDESFHARSEMLLRITEYCEFLKDDSYLPRTNELCLVREDGKWHRCVNLKSHKTTCCLFFIDDGHSSFIASKDIRKMIQDFTELPSQSVCCTLPDYRKLKNNEEYQAKVVNYLKRAVGQTICSVRVLKLMGDAYCLSFPDIKDMAKWIRNRAC